MKVTGVLLIVLGVIVLGGLLAGGCVFRGYNAAIALDEEVKGKWAQVENQLQRRFDLIPNLVETVKGFAGQEEKIFLGVANARKAYFQAKSTNEKARAAGMFESALSRLLVLRETYPQLKSDRAFQNLMYELAGTENRLSVERKRYNDTVKTLNTLTRTLTGRFYCSLAGVGPAEYFEIEEAAKAVPKLDFSETREAS